MRIVALAALIAAFASPVGAAALSDGFETETAGGSILNYAGFANWTVSGGTVDLVRSGEFGITCRTGNYCVDLDGSTNISGLFQTIFFDLKPADAMVVDFWISGNQRGGTPDQVGFGVLFDAAFLGSGPRWAASGPGFSIVSGDYFFVSSLGTSSFPLSPGTGFGHYRFELISSVNARASFYVQNFWFDANGDPVDDNLGAIIDDVTVQIIPIPEPASWAMLIAGFGLVGRAARRRRAALA